MLIFFRFSFEIFGHVIAKIGVIEFQKRGLPHVHVLVKFDDNDTPRTPEHFDRICCAEIPDKVKCPELYEIITKYNVHTPCEKHNPFGIKCPCLGDDGLCSKDFPKLFSDHTKASEDGYPQLRRRRGFSAPYKYRNQQYTITNEWIVSYNPYLSKKYNCHINVQLCNSIKAVKYLYK
jgi:hypothetical protein